MSFSNWKLGALGACALLLALVACDSGNAQTAKADAAPGPVSAEPAGKKSDWEVPAKPAAPATISQGQPVKLQDHLVPGGYTVFDFTSPYCGPCRQIAPYLDFLHSGREDVAVVKVDINRPGYRGIDFRSPVAQQYRVNKVPHFVVYDAEGTFVSQGDPAWQLVVGWIIDLQKREQQAGR